MAKSRFTSPKMRFVQGDVDEPQTTDAQGNPRVVKTGPNAGQPNPQYFVAGAIPKNSPEWPAFWEALVNQAVADFSNLFPQGAAPLIAAGGPTNLPAGACMHPQFSWKVIDGDGVDNNGTSNADKEGFAGCWVVRFASSYAPKAFHVGHYAPQEQIQEKGTIKRGYYIRVNGSIDGNGNAQRPGLYVNLDLVELTETCPPDQLIISGPSAQDAFGGGAPAAGSPAPAPATGGGTGGLAAAVADGWAPHPSAPGYHYKGQDVKPDAEVAALYPAAPAAPPASPPPPAAPAVPPASPPPPATPAAEPYTGYMEGGNAASGAAAPPPPGASTPPPSAPPATPSLTDKAAGFTYEQLIAAGWTDETLRANGYIA